MLFTITITISHHISSTNKLLHKMIIDLNIICIIIIKSLEFLVFVQSLAWNYPSTPSNTPGRRFSHCSLELVKKENSLSIATSKRKNGLSFFPFLLSLNPFLYLIQPLHDAFALIEEKNPGTVLLCFI